MRFLSPVQTSEKQRSLIGNAAFFLTFFSWPAYIFLVFDTGFWSWVPLIIVIILVALAYLAGRKALLLYALFSPVTLIVLYFSIVPTIHYFEGRPTWMYCMEDYYNFDPIKMVYVDHWFSDCDFDGYYRYSTDVNNSVTNFWIAVLGNPIDTIPADADIENYWYPDQK